ncbi:MAG: hypothetical protein WCS70_01945 [Verrucomicrobiota bacterium]
MRAIVWVYLLGLVAVPMSLRGEPGALDSGFGDGGVRALPLGAVATAVACQPDGKIVVGGGFGVTRLNQDGSFDAEFGDSGLATIGRSTNQTSSVGALLLQPDGKIVVSVGPGLARLLSSGALDTNFGEGGFSFGTAVTNRSDYITALQLQPDGKIIAGGSSNLKSGGGREFLVLRITADGVNDSDFGDRGRALTAFGSSLAAGRALILQGDGSMVIGGGVTANGHLAFALARFTATGILDAGFGTAGQLALPIAGANFSQLNGLALQSAGRIIAAGIANVTNNSDFVTVRLNQDGSLDGSFGDQGIQRTDFSNGSSDVGVAVTVTPDDKILVAGSTGPTIFKRQFALARYNPDGNLDESFGQGGLVNTQFPLSTADEAYALALVGDGRIILAGSSPINGATACALARYHVNDLAVLETANPDLVGVGDTLYYNVLVENNRLNGVTGVRLTDQLPSSVNFASAFSTQGTCTNVGDIVVCDLGSLARGGQATVTIFASMQATAHLCNRVTVSANETDPALTNSAIACATIDLLREKPQNFAVTAIRAPKRIALSATRPEVTKLVAVEIQNRSPRVERIDDLTGIVDLEVRSLTNGCPDLVPVLLTAPPQARLPVFLSPKGKLAVYFRVTYSKNCVADPRRTIRDEAHNDYRYLARSNHEAVDDNRDTFPADDVCPRSAVGSVTTAGDTITDQGCGGKVFQRGFGAPVTTDVIVK